MDYMRILVLEEDESKRLMLSMFLADQSLNKNTVYITLDELTPDLLQNEIFDLIIIDLNNLECGICDVVLKIKNLVDTQIIMVEEIVDLESYKDVNMEKVNFVDDILNFQDIHKHIAQLFTPSINISYLSEIAEVAMPEPEILIDKLTSSFYELAPQKIAQIEEFLKTGNFEATSKTAHALRSTCYNIGAHNFAETLKLLEETTRKGILKNTEKFWALILKHEYEKARNSLQDIINNKLYLKR